MPRTNILVRRQIYLTPQQDRAFRRLAKSSGLTASELIRRAMDAFLTDEVCPPVVMGKKS